MFYRSHRRATALLGFALCTAFTHPQPTLASAPSSALDANSRLVTIFGGGTKPLNQTSIATELSPQATARIFKITKSPDGNLLASFSGTNGTGASIVEMAHNGRIRVLPNSTPQTASGSKISLNQIDCNKKARCFAISAKVVNNQTGKRKVTFGSYAVKSGLFRPLTTTRDSDDCENPTSLVATNSDTPTVLISCKHSIHSFQTSESAKTAEKTLYKSAALTVGRLSQINGGPVTALLYNAHRESNTYQQPIKRLIVGLDGSVQERNLPANLDPTEHFQLYATDSQGNDIYVGASGFARCSSDGTCQPFNLSSKADQQSNISTPKDTSTFGHGYQTGMVYDADNETLGHINQLVHQVALPWSMPILGIPTIHGIPMTQPNRNTFYRKLVGFQDDGSLLFSQGAESYTGTQEDLKYDIGDAIIRAVVPADWQEFPTAGFNHISAEQIAGKRLPVFASRAGSIAISIKRVTGKYQFSKSKKDTVPIFKRNKTALNSPFLISVAPTPVAQGSSEITIPQTLEPGIYDLDLTFTADNDVIIKDHYRIFYNVPFNALSPKYINKLAIDVAGERFSEGDGGGGSGSYAHCHYKTCEYGSADYVNDEVESTFSYTFQRYRVSVAIEGIAIKPFGVIMDKTCRYYFRATKCSPTKPAR